MGLQGEKNRLEACLVTEGRRARLELGELLLGENVGVVEAAVGGGAPDGEPRRVVALVDALEVDGSRPLLEDLSQSVSQQVSK